MRTDHLDPAERQLADDEDRLLSELVADYAQRGVSPDELLAAAVAAGDACRECLARLIDLIDLIDAARPGR